MARFLDGPVGALALALAKVKRAAAAAAVAPGTCIAVSYVVLKSCCGCSRVYLTLSTTQQVREETALQSRIAHDGAGKGELELSMGTVTVEREGQTQKRFTVADPS